MKKKALSGADTTKEIPQSLQEDLAFVDGAFAMEALSSVRGAELSRMSRFEALMTLRRTARIDPSSAYNLGKYFSDSLRQSKRRPKRRELSIKLFERCVDLGLSRLNNVVKPVKAAPTSEKMIRDIVSRALTNVGADIYNMGYPDRAVSYFERAIELYPSNPVSHVCLGNVIVYYGECTNHKPLDGIAAWEKGAALGDYCHESAAGCPCRERICQVARHIKNSHGTSAASDWIRQRYPLASNHKKGSCFGFPFASLRAASTHMARSLPARSQQASQIIAYTLDGLRDQPLEIKVTIAGSLLGSLARMDDPLGPCDAGILEDAQSRLDDIEPMEPFLGDDEWANLSPPETLYLSEPTIRDGVQHLVDGTMTQLRARIPGLKAEEAVIGMMFLLDLVFRLGVSDMIRSSIEIARKPMVFVPATFVGGGRKNA